MDDIKKVFFNYLESSIRKRLKLCVDFKRIGQLNKKISLIYFRICSYCS